MENSTSNESPKPAPEAAKPAAAPRPPQSRRKWLIIVAVVASLLAVVAAGWYAYRYAQNKNTQIGKLESEIATANEAAGSLKGEVEQLRNRLDGVDQTLASNYYDPTLGEDFEYPTADITVENSFKYTEWFKDESGNIDTEAFALILDIAVKNNTDETVWPYIYGLKLKGSDNVVYPTYSSARFENANLPTGSLPDGRVNFVDTSLQPGEEVRGTLVFYVSKNISTFSLYNDQNDLIADIQL